MTEFLIVLVEQKLHFIKSFNYVSILALTLYRPIQLPQRLTSDFHSSSLLHLSSLSLYLSCGLRYWHQWQWQFHNIGVRFRPLKLPINSQLIIDNRNFGILDNNIPYYTRNYMMKNLILHDVILQNIDKCHCILGVPNGIFPVYKYSTKQ